MSIALDSLSASELKQLISSAQDQLVKGERARIKSVREKIQQLLKEEGLTLEQVFPSVARGAKRGAGTAGTVPPKYAHPDDPKLTWTGRGMKPRWFKDALSSGKTEEQLLVGVASSAAASPAAPSRAARKSSTAAKAAPRKTPTRKPRQG